MVSTSKEFATTVAARVAGEDLIAGDYITITNEIAEFPSYLWNDSVLTGDPSKPIRVQYQSSCAGWPRRIIGICLPFLYVKTPYDNTLTIDTRYSHVVRLDTACALQVWAELAPKPKKKKKKKRKQK